MAKVQDTRRRGARPAAASGAFPQDHSGGTELPLRTTGYTVRSSDNKSFRNAVLFMAGAMVVVLVFMSYNYDGAYVSEAVLTAIDEVESGAKKVVAYQPQLLPEGGGVASVRSSATTKNAGKLNDVKLMVENVPGDSNGGVREIDDPHKGIISDATGAWPTSTILRIYHDRKDCQGSSTKYETSKEVEETDEKTDLIKFQWGSTPRTVIRPACRCKLLVREN